MTLFLKKPRPQLEKEGFVYTTCTIRISTISALAKWQRSIELRFRLLGSTGLLTPCYVDEHSHYRYYIK